MTLDEAKKRIKQAAEESRRVYNLYEDDQSMGEEVGLITALSILKHVDTEPTQKDKMTLAELAHELRKFFRFKYLTVDNLYPRGRNIEIALWEDMPELDEYDHWQDNESDHVLSFYEDNMLFDLDLSEYEDENGEIDFSKCIVEVSDDAE